MTYSEFTRSNEPKLHKMISLIGQIENVEGTIESINQYLSESDKDGMYSEYADEAIKDHYICTEKLIKLKNEYNEVLVSLTTAEVE